MRFLFFILLSFGICSTALASVCEDAIRQVESQDRLPYQLLNAIANTESGRYLDGRVQPWPWTINVEGEGHYYNSKAEAIAAVNNLRKQGKTSIDVGCMQINQKHHPKSFSSLNEAFDPIANVTYAAKFLKELKAKHQTWARAIANYHSGEPGRQAIYKKRILNAWLKQRGQQSITRNQKVANSQQVANINKNRPAYINSPPLAYNDIARRDKMLSQRRGGGMKIITLPQ